MHDAIKHFLLWITGDGKWVLFSIPPAILVLQAVQAARLGLKTGMNPKKMDDEIAKMTNSKPKIRITVWGAATFVFFFYLIAAYVGDRM